jgi:hypothetical protein
MARNRFTKTEREAHLARVAELDRKGYPGAEIARLCNVTPQQISYDLRKIRGRYSEAAGLAHRAAVAEKIEQLRDLRYQAWQMWQKSQTDKPENDYLKIILDTLREESRLRGLYPPKTQFDVMAWGKVDRPCDLTSEDLVAVGELAAQAYARLEPYQQAIRAFMEGEQNRPTAGAAAEPPPHFPPAELPPTSPPPAPAPPPSPPPPTRFRV